MSGIEHSTNDDCITAWTEALTPGQVACDDETLRQNLHATFTTSQQCYCILFPESVKDVQSCVKIANYYNASLYTISKGKNWGLGSRVPVKTVHAIMDLSRLDNILEYNEELSYIVVEPGVTFEAVSNFLETQNSAFYFPVTGGPPEGSLIGNAADRGEGVGPYGDRLFHTCAYEVVLPSGDIINTGMARFDAAQSSHVHSHGVGPSLDGLFTQSNLGIITRMTFWLPRKPEYSEVFFCQISEAGRLPGVIEKVRQLIQQGAIEQNSFILWNTYKVLARSGQYPWRLMNNKTPLDIGKMKGQEPWYGNGVVYAASRDIATATRKHIETVLKNLVDDLHFLDSDSEHGAADNSGFVGKPVTANVKSTYWRKKKQPSEILNPEKDNCGVIWLCPVVPAIGESATEALELISTKIKSHGFEPNISVNFRDSRCLQLFVAIMYDRDEPQEDTRALHCHDTLLEQLVTKGHYPCRLGIQSMKALKKNQQSPYSSFLDALRDSIDPNNILSPGRYEQ